MTERSRIRGNRAATRAGTFYINQFAKIMSLDGSHMDHAKSVEE
jgi:flagellar basal body rod protein FlgG